ncbi:MAG: hypothetical protein ABL888_23210, partial [Pirellulaceae bacterium]
MDEFFAQQSLAELRALVDSKGGTHCRKQLTKQFLRYCLYQNAEQWNRAVRLCEALTIVGWGDLEPVEATRGMFWNGNPETAFFNKCSELRFVAAIWSKRKAGFTMEPGRTSYHYSPDMPEKPSRGDEYPVTECIQDIRLKTQRNWIPKNPILIGRTISNCYRNSAKLAGDVEDGLMPTLNKQMTPEAYGSAISRIVIEYNLSYPVGGCGETNYIILDEDVRLSSQQLFTRLKKMYSAKEIKENGYWLRKRFDFGGFKSDKGVINVQIHFSKEFSEQSIKAQKREFAKHLIEAVEGAVRRLRAKKLQYDFD